MFMENKGRTIGNSEPSHRKSKDELINEDNLITFDAIQNLHIYAICHCKYDALRQKKSTHFLILFIQAAKTMPF